MARGMEESSSGDRQKLNAEIGSIVIPCAPGTETGCAGQVLKFLDREFVGVFRANPLTLPEWDLDVTEVDRLIVFADQVHLDASSVFIVGRLMPKTLKVEIGAELPVNAGQQVEVERRRYPFGIIISRLNDIGVFLQVPAT